jgi:hypothetical protein
MVNRRSFVHRCGECRHTETFELPEIRKAVIYLDQFAVSGMMKAPNPRSPEHDAAKAEGWLLVPKPTTRIGVREVPLSLDLQSYGGPKGIRTPDLLLSAARSP